MHISTISTTSRDRSHNNTMVDVWQVCKEKYPEKCESVCMVRYGRCQLASRLWLANRTVRTVPVPVSTTQYSTVSVFICFDSQSSEPMCIIVIDLRSICLSLKVIISIAFLFVYFFYLYPLLFLCLLPYSCLMLAWFAKVRRAAWCHRLFFLDFSLGNSFLINIKALTSKFFACTI